MDPLNDESGPIPLIPKNGGTLPPQRTVLQPSLPPVSPPTPPPQPPGVTTPVAPTPPPVILPQRTEPPAKLVTPVITAAPVLFTASAPPRPIIASAVVESKQERTQSRKRAPSFATMITVLFIVLTAIIAFLYFWGARIEAERVLQEASIEE